MSDDPPIPDEPGTAPVAATPSFPLPMAGRPADPTEDGASGQTTPDAATDARHVSVLNGDRRTAEPSLGMSQRAKTTIVVSGCSILALIALIFVGFVGYAVIQKARTAASTPAAGKPHSADGKPDPNVAPLEGGKPDSDADEIDKPDANGRTSNPASWITPEDYPAEALRAHEQGTVAIRWTVRPEGNPAGCFVTQSSGFPRLDEAACSAIMRRASYVPLADGDRHIRSETRRVTWRLP